MTSRGPKTISRQPSVAELRPELLRVTQKYGVRNVRIFGSFARGEQRTTSDVDLLVDLPDGMTLFDLSGLKIDSEEAVKKRVDLVPDRSIKPALRDSILADARLL
jgi:predicted nucleotidyltransferase